MLFNSLGFVFVFLPLFLIIFYASVYFNKKAFLVVIIGASLIFYTWWYPPNLLLLIASILINYYISGLISPGAPYGRKHILTAGVALNIVSIGYFKYTDSLILWMNETTGQDFSLTGIILPLAISFFTFQQIAYLFEVYNGHTRRPPFLEYMAYVTFFPQLIAGPIVRPAELIPQFEARIRRPDLFGSRMFLNLSVGFTIFSIGLVKKVVFADTLGAFADPIYVAVGSGESVTFFEAWIAVASFGLQIYFDLSGYSDMAVGLARMAGFRLPINFSSPYRAANLTDLWQRWHITMTSFFTDYVYTPLAYWAARRGLAGRYGPVRRFVNSVFLPMMIAFILIGAWHGAGLKLLIFGALNGLGLVIHKAWGELRRSFGWSREARSSLGILAARVLTLGVFFSTLVMFRSADVGAAIDMYGTMIGMKGFVLSDTMFGNLGPLTDILARAGLEFGPAPYWQGTRHWVWLLFAAAIVFFMPNTYELLVRYKPAIVMQKFAAGWSHQLRPLRAGRFWDLVCCVATWLCLGLIVASWILVYFQQHPPFQQWVPTLWNFVAAGVGFFGLLVLPRTDPGFRWRPNSISAVFVLILFVYGTALMMFSNEQVFIYFNF